MAIHPFATSMLFDANFAWPAHKNLTVNQGGTSSGKTYSILQVLFLKAFEFERSRITVVGQDIPNLKKGAIRDAQTIVFSSPFIQNTLLGYNKTDRIYYFKNGSIIEFTSYQDGQDAKNGKRDFLFLNEANGVGYEIFKELFQRTSKHTWIDFNPTGEFWLHEKAFLQRPTVRMIKSTYIHNPFVDAEIIKKIEAYEPTPENIANGTADEYLWQVYGLGEMGILEGVLFPINELKFYDPLTINWKGEETQIEHKSGYVDIADDGEDDHCALVGCNIGAPIYIPPDIVFTKDSVEINSKETASLFNNHKPEYAQVEVNTGGTMYPMILTPLLETTTIIPIWSKANKKTRIYSASSLIKKYCYFCSNYKSIPQYHAFMKQLTEYLKDGSSKHDDAPDALAGLVNFITRSLSHLYKEVA